MYVLSGYLGKFCEAVALLIDMGEVLRASAVGFERRKRLLDICVDLPSSKDLVVLAMLDDKLVHVVVGISKGITNMDDLLNPANIIVLAVIAAGLFFGFRRIVASTHGKCCCGDGAGRKKVKRVAVADTDVSHYPYSDELLIGGMSCGGCAQNVTNALNALDGIWATVTYTDHTACIRSKNPIDREVLEAAVRDAGYYVMKP